VGRPGTERDFEVVLNNTVQERFRAKVLDRRYDWAWRQMIGGGLSGKIKVFRVGAEAAFETEVHQEIVGGAPMKESITRRRQAELRAGVEVGGGLKVGRIVNAGAKAGAGGYAGFDLSSTFHFEPDAPGLRENGMKLYVALGDYLRLAPLPNGAVYGFFQDKVEPLFLDSRLDETEATMRLGAYAGAWAEIGFRLARNFGIGASAEAYMETEGIAGMQEIYRPEPMRVMVSGAAVDAGFSSQVGAYLRTYRKEIEGIGIGLFANADLEVAGKVWKKASQAEPHQVSFEQIGCVGAGLGIVMKGWDEVDEAGLGIRDGSVRYREVLTYELNRPGGFNRLKAVAPAWDFGMLRGAANLLTPDQPARMLEGMLESSQEEGMPLEYERWVYVGRKEFDADLELDLDAILAGLNVKLDAELERGVEDMVEQGRLRQFRRMPLRYYSPLRGLMLPSESLVAMEARWLRKAQPDIQSVLKQTWHVVKDVGETVIESVAGAGRAVLSLVEGALPTGSTVVSESAAGAGSSGARGMISLHRLLSPLVVLPPPGASNYVYGVGGFYRFTSTNTLSKPAILSIAYSTTEVAGLCEAELRMYFLDDATGSWRLVGGVVDTNANIVTATITNLGTFALAPPLPAGQLQIQLSRSILPADGVSLLTATVTNILLNNGLPATQPWLFTVEAAGLDVLNADLDAELAGVQLIITNASLEILLRAPSGGKNAALKIKSFAGDAFGEAPIGLVDLLGPSAPTELHASPGQSRIWLSWHPSPEPDVAGYRVYYRADRNGPPYDGTATIDGLPSPVTAGRTNHLLCGLSLGSNYFIRAVDSSGLVSALLPGTRIGAVGTATDRDADGLPDDWELAHGLNANDPSDVLLDADDDGMANGDEFLAGNDPRDPNRRLFIAQAEKTGDDVVIRFATVGGKKYRVEWIDNLGNSGWQVLADSLPGDGAEAAVWDRGGGSNQKRFYRVVLVP
jgi:hypothetical protein